MSGTFCDLIKLSQHSWACVHVACPSPTGKAQRGQWFLPRFLHQREAAGPNLHQPHLGLKSKVCLLLAQFAGGRLSATVNCQTATPRPPSSPRPSGNAVSWNVPRALPSPGLRLCAPSAGTAQVHVRWRVEVRAWLPPPSLRCSRRPPSGLPGHRIEDRFPLGSAHVYALNPQV